DSGAVALLVAEWRLLSMLRSRGYELVIHLSEHPRGAWLARSLGARYAVAPDFARKPPLWKKSFTHLVPLPPHARRHRVEINLDALRRIGIQPGEDERKLVLVPGEDAERSVEGLLAGQGLAPGRFVHFHPGSRWQFKCWPSERAAALIEALAQRGERVALTAAPDERELDLIAQIRKRTRADVARAPGFAHCHPRTALGGDRLRRGRRCEARRRLELQPPSGGGGAPAGRRELRAGGYRAPDRLAAGSRARLAQRQFAAADRPSGAHRHPGLRHRGAPPRRYSPHRSPGRRGRRERGGRRSARTAIRK